MRAFIVAILCLIPITIYASGKTSSGGLAERVAELEAQVAAMEEILQFVHVETGELQRLAGPHWIIEGANVHVRSGSGETGDGCDDSASGSPQCESLTGLGNLIVGYNEYLVVRGQSQPIRTGSHNLVVGKWHSYSSLAGFVVGRNNTVSRAYSSVSGGSLNQAIGFGSSVSGGRGNVASGIQSSVSGGLGNFASGNDSSVSGGDRRTAPGDMNWAAGSLFQPN
jgi:hypothetical protein